LLTGGTSFGSTELDRLKVAIDAFAARVAPAMLTASGCNKTGQEQRDCLVAWSLQLSEKAFRRSTRSGEGDRVKAIFQSAGVSPEDDVKSMTSMLGAIFFAPSFLYRTEIGTAIPGKANLRSLSEFEIANRLSFLATLAPPDAELTAAAKAGKLSDGGERVRQFERLSKTDRGRRAFAVFVLEWMGANEPNVSTKSEQYLQGLGGTFETAIRLSADTTIRKLLEGNADVTVADLLQTRSYLEDAAVQTITQPATVAKVATGDGGDANRTGLLMHPQVLSGLTKEDGSSPFQMGMFVREGLLCDPLATPPDGAADLAKTDEPAGLTVRETLEYRTSVAGGCVACHSQFSPFGYAFLAFDPVGRWMKQDPSGKPWDLSGNVQTYSQIPLTFSSPSDLVKALASHPQVRGCFSETALRWAFGRAVIDEDASLIVALNGVANSASGGIVAIFRTIVSSPQFVNVAVPR
jgi:hypothetical protein